MASLKDSQKKPYFGLKGGWLTFWITRVARATDMNLFAYDQGLSVLSKGGVVVTEDFLVVHDLVGRSKTKTLSAVAAIYDVGCSASIVFFFLFYIFFGLVFNVAFLPVIYFFYPETANRSLEDIDAYYRSNPSLIVIKDPDAISVKPPLKYIEHEDHEMRKIDEIKTKNADALMVEHVE
ncbi:hypothetical protein ABOM_007565 [Aspergillus bombycis]|uniref:Uncharacterized protein n=1 Tax=Aspergillus bombycis TaxID=109264 RepID=A0A1F7ZX25_9EURO|nr:hypothetical protein ABOM_007565 [Aspergillus bombycis]OGM43809.1 hypothetical protein ABOM_007565 [Aspergillus bombycis]